MDLIETLNDTLEICKKGYYIKDDKKIVLKLSENEMKKCRVFLPDGIELLKTYKIFEHVHVMGRCGYGCENADSFTVARNRIELSKLFLHKNDVQEILVLNLANPVNPGGGVRSGACAQEEDLCRKSSLLLSLESDIAKTYYSYNRELNTHLGSNAIIVTPQVEIIKDENGELLDDTVVVAVMTCAAPMIRDGLEGLSDNEYKGLLYERISGMLRCAAYLGYKQLVLGAFGCGAFGNDARIVSDLFYKALKEFNFDGMHESDMFRRIDFAVLSTHGSSYNFNEFYRNFGGNNFYKAEDDAEVTRKMKAIKAKEVNLDKIRGSLIGGAIGDALGYPVEFLDRQSILSQYGTSGITEYKLSRTTGKALISDDTQMTLFTANGILVGDTRDCMRGIAADPHVYVQQAYLDWLLTQNEDYSTGKKTKRYNGKCGISWLLDVPELYDRRAPGNTCLSALSYAYNNEFNKDLIKNPANSSKGCGGIMRVAPLALFYTSVTIDRLDKEGALISAITHGHSLGYMPAAVLTHIINRIVYPGNNVKSLKDIVVEARDTIQGIYSNDEHIGELVSIINKAITLSENTDTDENNIPKLGEGWVAEETLAISIYCSLRYEHDFSAGVIAAVNHNGDSDSTGAVTGNILGAINGYDNIEDKWKNNLELMDVLTEMCVDLCHGCQMSEYSTYRDPDWERKYMHMEWKNKQEVVYFWREYDDNGCFGNWFRTSFVIDDFCYRHVEQYLMAQKAKLFHDSKRYTAILRADTPEECKQLGREVFPFDNSVWEEHRYSILKAGVKAKFEQSNELMEKLLSTGNSVIAEASPKDNIFGIGMSKEEAEQVDFQNWRGQNLLGKALMEVRAELSNDSQTVSDIVRSPSLDMINSFLRNGGNIPESSATNTHNSSQSEHSKVSSGEAYSLEYIKGYFNSNMEKHPGARTSTYDSSLKKWRMRIQLDESGRWFLSVFRNEDGTLDKYSLDDECADDSQYEFVDEIGVKKKLCTHENENKYLAEIMIDFIKSHSASELLKQIYPFVTKEFHY